MVCMKTNELMMLGAAGVAIYFVVYKGSGRAAEGVGEGIYQAGTGIGGGIGDVGGYVGDFVGDVGDTAGVILDVTEENIKEIDEAIVNPLISNVGEVVDLTGEAVTDVVGMAPTATGAISSVNKGFWNAFNQTWNLNEPTNIFTNTAKGISAITGGIASAVVNTASAAKSAVTSAARKVSSGVSRASSSVKSSVSKTASAAKSAVTSAARKVSSVAKSTVSKVSSAAKSVASKAKSAVTSAASKVRSWFRW